VPAMVCLGDQTFKSARSNVKQPHRKPSRRS
jgi:hypothetical protein